MPNTSWHQTSEISGIGSALAGRLADLGFHSAESLLRRPPFEIAQDLEHVQGITLDNLITSFVPQAGLLRLPDMTETAAAALADKAYDYGRLAFGDADDVSRLLADAGMEADAEVIAAWRLDAAKRLRTATMTIRVRDELGQPIPDANIFVVDPARTGDAISWRWVTGADGDGLVEYLAAGMHEILVTGLDKMATLRVALAAEEFGTLVAQLDRSAPAGVTYDEHIDGPRQFVGAVVRTALDGTELVDGMVLSVTSLAEESVRLTDVLRRRVGTNWFVDSIDVPRTEISGEIEIGHLFAISGETPARMAGSADAYRNDLIRSNALRKLNVTLGGQDNAN